MLSNLYYIFNNKNWENWYGIPQTNIKRIERAPRTSQNIQKVPRYSERPHAKKNAW